MKPEGFFADVKPFAVHDGPGIRTTLFLKGCSLRCVWCHNPETNSRKPELAFFASKCVFCGRCAAVCRRHILRNGVHAIDRNGCTVCGECVKRCPAAALRIYGEKISVEEAFRMLTADRMFYENSGGGVTISGGEPLLQPEFCAALFRRLHEAGVHTALDSCGNVPWSNFELVLPWTDLVLFDLKAADSEVHRKCTGSDNRLILENLRRLDECGVPLEIRMPLMTGWNDTEDDLRKAGELLGSLRSAPVPVRLLSCHDFARSKYAAVGRPDTMPHPETPEFSAAEFLGRYPVRLIN